MKKYILLIVSLLFFHLSIAQKMYKYRYADGSSNVYLIDKSQIEYKPVKKENSSSGVYSGGDPATEKITAEQFAQIEQLFQNLFKDKSVHIENRLMGSGYLERSKGKKKESCIVAPNTPAIKELEQHLKQLLKK